MKANIKSALSVSLLLLLLISYSCRKNTVSSDQPNRVDSIAFAGNDTTILQPDSSVTLSASYKGQNTLKRVEWKKLIGRNSNFENPQGLTTKVSGLEGGTYEFEVTMFDSQNNYGKDKISVTVSSFVATPNSVTFTNLSWVFNWSAPT